MIAPSVAFVVLGPGEYERAKKILDRAKHPGFVGRELFFRCATGGQAVVATVDGEGDLGVALIVKSKLQALSVVTSAQGRGIGAVLVAHTLPTWVNAIQERVPWFAKRGYLPVGAPKVSTNGSTAIQLMQLDPSASPPPSSVVEAINVNQIAPPASVVEAEPQPSPAELLARCAALTAPDPIAQITTDLQAKLAASARLAAQRPLTAGETHLMRKNMRLLAKLTGNPLP